MRFSEATALAAADIDVDAKTCRINKAWKYSGDYRPVIGPPKTKKSIRTISLPPAALEVIDLTAPSFLFTNGAGNPVRAQEFYNGGWEPARDSAMKAGLTKSPRVHDLRHTCASWMIHAGVPCRSSSSTSATSPSRRPLASTVTSTDVAPRLPRTRSDPHSASQF